MPGSNSVCCKLQKSTSLDSARGGGGGGGVEGKEGRLRAIFSAPHEPAHDLSCEKQNFAPLVLFWSSRPSGAVFGFRTSTHRDATKFTESPHFGKRRLLKQSVFQ